MVAGILRHITVALLPKSFLVSSILLRASRWIAHKVFEASIHGSIEALHMHRYIHASADRAVVDATRIRLIIDPSFACSHNG